MTGRCVFRRGSSADLDTSIPEVRVEVRPWPWPFFVRSGCAGSAGCGPLTAAKIVAETADVTRFSSEAAFACHAGLVPRPAWSGATSGTLRAGRRGNRHLNRALRKIALTQTRMDGPGKAYVERRVAAGDKQGHRAALPEAQAGPRAVPEVVGRPRRAAPGDTAAA